MLRRPDASTGCSIFLLRFADGEVVALDAERFRRVTEPYLVAGGPEEGFSRLRAQDGAKRTATTSPTATAGCGA